MKLLNSYGPNPRAVRMFLIEKGIEMPFENLDLMAADNRAEAYLKRNPGGQMPALELDDGTAIGETTTICEYLEDLHPTPVLIGSTPEEKANTRQWVRRVELNITEHMYNGFRFAEGYEMFKDRLYCIPEAADGLKAKAKYGRAWLDNLMAGRDYIAGDKMTIADIILYCCSDFCKDVGQAIDTDLPNIAAHFARMNDRPSAAASLDPASAELKMAG